MNDPVTGEPARQYHAEFVVTAELKDIEPRLRYANRDWRYQPERIEVKYVDDGNGWQRPRWATLHGHRLRKDGTVGADVQETLWKDGIPGWAVRFIEDNRPTP